MKLISKISDSFCAKYDATGSPHSSTIDLIDMCMLIIVFQPNRFSKHSFKTRLYQKGAKPQKSYRLKGEEMKGRQAKNQNSTILIQSG